MAAALGGDWVAEDEGKPCEEAAEFAMPEMAEGLAASVEFALLLVRAVAELAGEEFRGGDPLAGAEAGAPRAGAPAVGAGAAAPLAGEAACSALVELLATTGVETAGPGDDELMAVSPPARVLAARGR